MGEGNDAQIMTNDIYEGIFICRNDDFLNWSGIQDANLIPPFNTTVFILAQWLTLYWHTYFIHENRADSMYG